MFTCIGAVYVVYLGMRRTICIKKDIEFSALAFGYKLLNLQGVPKKMVIWKGFEFWTLGGVFLGVKNNSKNFGNKTS